MKIFLKEFEIVDPQIPEIPESSAEETARKLSLLKALSVFERNPDAIVIGADTVVEIDGKILGKPENPNEAKQQLLTLSGRWHTVHTAVAVVNKLEVWQKHFVAKVKFRKVPNDFIDFYANNFSVGKAGSYGLQDLGAVFVEHIVGDPYVVIGLPIGELALYLKKKGWWNFETTREDDQSWF